MEGVRMIPTQATLVEFDEPAFVRDVEKEEQGPQLPPVLGVSVDHEIKRMTELRVAPHCPDPSTYEHFQVNEILNIVIPPVEWIEDGQMWRQTVSTDEVSRDDLLTLEKDLDAKLKARHAFNVGICPIRRQLYDQFFDELIRQVTLRTPETGLMLMRVRDELRMTLDATASVYDTCKYFESNCINVPVKPVSQPETSETEMDELALGALRVETEKSDLKQKIRNLEDGLRMREVKLQQMLDAGESLFQEKCEHLKKVKEQLTKQLELFKAPNPHGDENVTQSILDKFIIQAPKN